MKFSNSSIISLITSSAIIFTTIAHGEDKVPLIYDIDANSDDFLALMYVASNPLFDLKAVTTAGAGFSSHHGGPINTQQILELFDKGDVPVSFGKPLSLSPMTSFPLRWKIELDEFFQYSNLTKSNALVSVYESDQLISKILRESPVAVAIAITGPATNLALALQKEPELINRISSIFIMGSNYGGGPNNVYDWQMTMDGIEGNCVEDFSTDNFSHNIRPLSWELEDGSTEKVSIRPGCRGNNMDETGDTEWNLFLDAFGWHVVTRIIAEASTPPMMYAVTTGASEEMPIVIDDFDKGLEKMEDKSRAKFIRSLGIAFLKAGEAKWWDAQLVVAMADIITNVPEEQEVCSKWLKSTGFKVNLNWHRVKTEDVAAGKKNPYGSITDVDGIGPVASFCRHGNVKNMQDTYWEALSGDPGSTTVADQSIYLRKLTDSIDH